MRTWSQLGAQDEKSDSRRGDVRTPLCRAFGPKLPRRQALTTLGEGPPRIVTLRGSARGSILENLPQQGEIMPSISKICPLCVQKVQNPPKFLHKPSQNLPKASQNPSRSPLGAHFGPMLERSSILNVQKTAKRRPKAPKGGPRRPQTLPKWSPRPSQN